MPDNLTTQEPKYYPSLKNLITLDAIPDNVDFIKSALTRLFSKIYYKDFQPSVSNDGSAAFYSLRIVTRERLEFKIPGTELSFIPNPDYDDSNISSFQLLLNING